ncbi:MAG TPA: [Fe-Fe] hydrogenase large subunit C-terminal domain-containing protein [Candidatus Paceibacterota bacterium]|nr:[Fe-Fe] hydrogenase large subunit C-terminal domain-containing protein [Candidatus Paceibacterota bacterium]
MKKELTVNNFISKANPNKNKLVAMLAPSFVSEFKYPEIIFKLKKLGFDKVVELTFGAKMINRDYYKILESNKKSKKLIISTVCPGIVETIKLKYPKLKDNLIVVDSPMAATAKICKKEFPKHKTVFISPCNFKKIEAERTKYVDYVIDYQELKKLLDKRCTSECKISSRRFDRFYNDYTKIYPLAGGLSKTAKFKSAINKNEIKIIDGILDVEKFLNNRNSSKNKNIRFLDVNFCKGGCIGGPCLSKNISLAKKKKRILDYMKLAKKEDIPNCDLGTIDKSKGISFTDTKFK